MFDPTGINLSNKRINLYINNLHLVDCTKNFMLEFKQALTEEPEE
jgi:hypothetical protein